MAEPMAEPVSPGPPPQLTCAEPVQDPICRRQPVQDPICRRQLACAEPVQDPICSRQLTCSEPVLFSGRRLWQSRPESSTLSGNRTDSRLTHFETRLSALEHRVAEHSERLYDRHANVLESQKISQNMLLDLKSNMLKVERQLEHVTEISFNLKPFLSKSSDTRHLRRYVLHAIQGTAV